MVLAPEKYEHGVFCQYSPPALQHTCPTPIHAVCHLASLPEQVYTSRQSVMMLSPKGPHVVINHLSGIQTGGAQIVSARRAHQMMINVHNTFLIVNEWSVSVS